MRASLSHIFLLHFCFPLLYSPSFSSDVSFPLIFIYSLFFWGPGKNISRLLILERKVLFIYLFFSLSPLISFHFISFLCCCLVPPPSSAVCLLTAKLSCSMPWPGTALDERFAARALFQSCLLLHPCSLWALCCPCQEDWEKEGKGRRLRRERSEGKVTSDKQQQEVEKESEILRCALLQIRKMHLTSLVIKEALNPGECS